MSVKVEKFYGNYIPFASVGKNKMKIDKNILIVL